MQRLACGLIRARGLPSCMRTAVFSLAPLQSVPRRWASSTQQPPGDIEVQTASHDDYYHGNSNAHDLPSTEVRDEEDGGMEEDFDELEAASQELHDLCYAMVAHLRRADPEAHKLLFERRVKRSFREPKPEAARRLIHGHGDRSNRRPNSYRSAKDFAVANQLYLEWGNKLLLLLTKPVLDRLVKSAGKGHRDLRSDGLHKNRGFLERATWRTFPYRWYKHAPFEVQQLRADIPQSAVLNTRFYRDQGTLKSLFTLMEPQHAFRAQIERRMYDLTRDYDPLSPHKKK